MKYKIKQKIQTQDGFQLAVCHVEFVTIYLPVSEDDFNRFNCGDEFEAMLIPIEKEATVA